MPEVLYGDGMYSGAKTQGAGIHYCTRRAAGWSFLKGAGICQRRTEIAARLSVWAALENV